MIDNKGVTYMYSDSRVVDEDPDVQPLLDTLLLETGAIRYSAWQARASSKKILYTVFIALKAI